MAESASRQWKDWNGVNAWISAAQSAISPQSHNIQLSELIDEPWLLPITVYCAETRATGRAGGPPS
jgi:hypothetical protein